MDPEVYLDQAYVQALRQRNKIYMEMGLDKSADLDAESQRATKKRP